VIDESEKSKASKGESKKSVQNSASASKASKAAEEIKENIPLNFPPKDLEKLRPTSSPSYDPINDAPFYKG
jgi:hypothetical protein